MNPIEYRRMYEVEDSHWWYVAVHEHILGIIARESARLGIRPRILDAGCGTGRLCQLMSDYGEVEGIDASAEAIRCCQEREVAARLGDLNDPGLTPGRYDIITSIDVLYHADINNDVETMKKLLAALKPGGMLILQVPAFEFLRSTHDMAVHTRERYTRQLLRDRLQRAGFRCELVRYRISSLFPLIAIYRLVARRFVDCRAADNVDSDVSLPHPALNALLLKIIKREDPLGVVCPFPAGSSVFAVARNPCAAIKQSNLR